MPVLAFGWNPDGFQRLIAFNAPAYWLFFLLVGIAVFVLAGHDADRSRPFSGAGLSLDAARVLPDVRLDVLCHIHLRIRAKHRGIALVCGHRGRRHCPELYDGKTQIASEGTLSKVPIASRLRRLSEAFLKRFAIDSGQNRCRGGWVGGKLGHDN